MERSDGELVRECRRGDKEAFRKLVERYQRKVTSVALGMVHNREDAMEIAQETFVKAFENIAHFKGESSFYTWLYRIVVNRAIDFQRRERRHPTVGLEERSRSGEEYENILKEERPTDPYHQAQAHEIGPRAQLGLPGPGVRPGERVERSAVHRPRCTSAPGVPSAAARRACQAAAS